MVPLKQYLKVLFALIFCSVFLSAFASPIEIGKSAPFFKAMTLSGEEIDLRQFQGKTVVLEWSNFECPFVRKHYDSQNMQRLQQKYIGDELVWITIFSSAKDKQGYYTERELKTRLAQEGNRATYIIRDPDGRIGRLYDAKTTPHMYVINRVGDLAYMGAIDSIRSVRPSDIPNSTNYVKEALDAILNGKPVKVATTKPYGCSVKYE